MRRGEVWWYEEPDGRRPACILTRDAVIPTLHSVIVVPATRTVRKIPTEVPLGQEDGMPEPCVLTLDNVLTVFKAQLTERVTTLSPIRMHEVCMALAVATGC